MGAANARRLNLAPTIVEKMACNAAPIVTRSCRPQFISRPSISRSNPLSSSSQSYATISNREQATSRLRIPIPSTSTHRGPYTFIPPTISEVQSNLPAHPYPRSSRPKLQLGTVTRTGTMRSSVQISYNTQRFDNWFKRHTQHTTRILAHEPTGYLREGDVVEFARFSPATMAERYESGKLNRRGGGVRYEVHRVVTPFGEPVAERKELPKEGELADRFGDVEFQRRSVELTKPWNKKDKKRRVGILEAMWEAIQMEVERVREQSSSKVKQVKVVEQAFAGSGETLSTDTLTEALSDAQKDIEIQLQKLRGESPSAAA